MISPNAGIYQQTAFDLSVQVASERIDAAPWLDSHRLSETDDV